MTYPDGPPIGTPPLNDAPLKAKIGDELPTGSVELSHPFARQANERKQPEIDRRTCKYHPQHAKTSKAQLLEEHQSQHALNFQTQSQKVYARSSIRITAGSLKLTIVNQTGDGMG